MDTASLVLVVLLLAALLAWVIGGRGRRRGSRRGSRPAVTDPDELAAAEDEVRELDTFTSPDEADDQLPDWGPGAGPR